MPVTSPQQARAPADHQAMAELLAESVRAAGALALTFFRGSNRSWFKDNNSPVSEADLAVDRLLRQRLMEQAGNIAWLSEESEDNAERLSARHVFVVDPIDGTRAFLNGRSDWVVSAALVDGGRPVAAAIYAPVSDELFVGAAGRGAWRNGSPLRASAGAALTGARLTGPKPLIEHLQGAGHGFAIQPRVHSLALRLTRVADGSLDAAFTGGNSHDWDLAAADLLVHEAGGILSTLAGQRPAYNQFKPVHAPLLAAGAARHAALLKMARGERIPPG